MLSSLTPAIAAAIRATWPKHMRKTYSDVPGFFTHCACQHGVTPPCQKGRHDLCGRATPLRRPEACICDKRGMVTHFRDSYQHPSDVSAVGPSRTNAAQVWLADRVCRWQCPCTCHTAPATAATVPARGQPTGQLSLLDELETQP